MYHSRKFNLKCRWCDSASHNSLLCRRPKTNNVNTITGRGRTRGGARGRGTRGRGPTRSKPSQQASSQQQASPQQQDTETLQSEQCKPCQQYIPKQITYVRSTPRSQN